MTSQIREFKTTALPTAMGWAAAAIVVSGVYSFYPGLRDGVDVFYLVMAPLIIAMGAYYAVAFLRRDSPVVRLTGESLEFGSPFPFRRHGSVRLGEVQHVEVLKRELRLATAGGNVDVPWLELSEGDRQALREEVERRVGA